MKAIFTLVVVLFFSLYSYSQNLDFVVSTQGDSIICKIDSITDSHIYFERIGKSGGYQQNLPLSLLKSYSYNSITKKHYSFKNGIATLKTFDKNSYKYLKMKYSKQLYSPINTDKYSLEGAGFLALIPSLGHFYTGEPLRGLAFIGGMGGSFVTMVAGYAMAWSGSDLGVPLFFIGGGGIVFFYIWNIIDAVQVAKVKNLAIRNNDISLKVLPNFEFSSVTHQPMNNFGVRLLLTF
jgi:hypothetical protein